MKEQDLYLAALEVGFFVFVFFFTTPKLDFLTRTVEIGNNEFTIFQILVAIALLVFLYFAFLKREERQTYRTKTIQRKEVPLEE
jgi:hypothetical protein